MAREFSRKTRVDVQLQRELPDLIRQLTDPRVAGVTVTKADISPDLRQAKILVSNFGDDASLKLAVDGLNHAAGKLRHGLTERLRMRTVPQLRFHADVQLREADRLTLLIRDAMRSDAEAASERSEHPAAPDAPERGED